MDESHKDTGERKKTNHRRLHIVTYHFYKAERQIKELTEKYKRHVSKYIS